MKQPTNSEQPSIILRHVQHADLPTLFEHQRDPAANALAAFPARDRDAFDAHWKKTLADHAVAVRTIELNGKVVGNIVCWRQGERWLVGYWMGPEHWGQGLATAALKAFVQLVEQRPLYAWVAKHNGPSIRVLQKCGFKVCEESLGESTPLADGVEEFSYRLD